MDVVQGALRVMAWGVGGVFVVLGIFYGLVKLMIKMFPAKDGE